MGSLEFPIARAPFILGCPESLPATEQALAGSAAMARRILASLGELPQTRSLQHYLDRLRELMAQLPSASEGVMTDDLRESQENRDNDVAFGIERHQGDCVALMINATLDAVIQAGELTERNGMGLDLEIPELLEHIKLRNGETIVDIGGGSGPLLTHMLEKWPESRGILFDLPVATDIARQRLSAGEKADYVEIVAGDFFKAVPGNGSFYLLSHVLHDWSDEDCHNILTTCRRSMPDNAQLAVVDLVIDDAESTQPNTTGAMMDLYMLSLFGITGGKERSESEFRALIEQSGFVVEQVKRLPSGNGIIYAYPK